MKGTASLTPNKAQCVRAGGVAACAFVPRPKGVEHSAPSVEKCWSGRAPRANRIPGGLTGEASNPPLGSQWQMTHLETAKG
jgi:hypothetical protein